MSNSAVADLKGGLYYFKQLKFYIYIYTYIYIYVCMYVYIYSNGYNEMLQKERIKNN